MPQSVPEVPGTAPEQFWNNYAQLWSLPGLKTPTNKILHKLYETSPIELWPMWGSMIEDLYICLRKNSSVLVHVTPTLGFPMYQAMISAVFSNN